MTQAESTKPNRIMDAHAGKFRGSVLEFDGQRRSATLEKVSFDREANEFRQITMWFSSQRQVDDAQIVLEEIKAGLPAENGDQTAEGQNDEAAF